MKVKSGHCCRPLRRTVAARALAAALAVVGFFSLDGCGGRPIERPNIVLITLDTTRVDRLGSYGYHRHTSPNLDRLAGESVLYTRALATSSWTLPSHASLFTGKLTASHGARYDPEGPLRLRDAIDGPESWDRYRARGLARDEVTLATLLRQHGYATGAVVAGPWMKSVFGLGKGFDYYDDSQIDTVNGRVAARVTAGALKWVVRSREKSFFLFLNYFDPHAPYAAPAEFVAKFLPGNPSFAGRRPTAEEISALYDAEVRYMDHYIGRFLRKLREWNLYDRTWIIVTADHGELLGEHGKFGHGHYLFEEELHVPLFMKHPAGEAAAGTSDRQVQLTDVLPMICDRLGIETPRDIQGVWPSDASRPPVAETYPLEAFSGDGDWRALYDGDFKFLWNSRGSHRLFDLAEDPKETADLAAKDSKRAETMLARLDEYLAGLPEPGPADAPGEVDQETQEALESLGYLD